MRGTLTTRTDAELCRLRTLGYAFNSAAEMGMMIRTMTTAACALTSARAAGQQRWQVDMVVSQVHTLYSMQHEALCQASAYTK